MKHTKSLKVLSAGLVGLGVAVLADANVNEAHATCVPEPYLGSVCITAGVYCPRDYVELNGGTLNISNYQALFAVIGTSFGGNGMTTMGVPDLRGRSAVHHGTGPGLAPAIFGTTRGVQSVTADLNTLAEHSHAATFTPSGGGSGVTVSLKAATDSNPDLVTPANGSYIAQAGTGFSAAPSFVSAPTGTVELGGVTVSGSGSGGGTVTVANTGESLSATNIPPQLTMRFCMAIEGLYPPRT
ncbi:tail fiber protein [Magnetovibrio sp. PR-2]|uniref:phage tail protein n=1 Tax=Magnetovibrio sp. PR-2 TaxID=3120356 RepID=UPI002FCDFA8B